jgi:hypothetical protein
VIDQKGGGGIYSFFTYMGTSIVNLRNINIIDYQYVIDVSEVPNDVMFIKNVKDLVMF